MNGFRWWRVLALAAIGAASFGLRAILGSALLEFGIGLLCAAAALGLWSFALWNTDKRKRLKGGGGA
jgi:hypothetical protein